MSIFFELFSPGTSHRTEELRRLDNTREAEGVAEPGRGPIDLSSGRVLIRPNARTASDEAESAEVGSTEPGSTEPGSTEPGSIEPAATGPGPDGAAPDDAPAYGDAAAPRAGNDGA